MSDNPKITTAGCIGATALARLTLRERFWSKVDIRGPDECWEWQGSKDRDGYGMFYVRYSPRIVRSGAHRVAHELTHGEVEGEMVLHSCDNPPCCNPLHLHAGDQRLNMCEMVARGRHRGNNPALPISKILAVRAAYDAASRSGATLARGELVRLSQKFSLRRNVISRIGRRQTYRLAK